mmetsp:Transcript_41175/g.68471  ORF Transcript_41175/g.68471 Transcript_41175/m.68471 type:complete len:183 (+) Transcript_41175:82-630(+)|eukprot:CAMPEP_0119321510 /NCGR_PEP_ID=MMETSP1333-20130426/55593_1 /TAXON_ID=418940 /ORGANISM="Scyphosphaera apsteinii, Strain RCC1455" /LENGTH=182 /DNA_ID=CAMNT_0007328499 /DNA_START=82 /DNA_END=630 /DNA_ORIENTATION=+
MCRHQTRGDVRQTTRFIVAAEKAIQLADKLQSQRAHKVLEQAAHTGQILAGAAPDDHGLSAALLRLNQALIVSNHSIPKFQGARCIPKHQGTRTRGIQKLGHESSRTSYICQQHHARHNASKGRRSCLPSPSALPECKLSKDLKSLEEFILRLEKSPRKAGLQTSQKKARSGPHEGLLYEGI